MARESALWQRLHGAATKLREAGHGVDLQRLENAIAVGHPDVEGCIDAGQVWIELKSNVRPKRLTTPVHAKLRESQSIWHRKRTDAGSRTHWVLWQIGEAHNACLYLIPGLHYDRLKSIAEVELRDYSYCDPKTSPAAVLLMARAGW